MKFGDSGGDILFPPPTHYPLLATDHCSPKTKAALQSPKYSTMRLTSWRSREKSRRAASPSERSESLWQRQGAPLVAVGGHGPFLMTHRPEGGRYSLCEPKKRLIPPPLGCEKSAVPQGLGLDKGGRWAQKKGGSQKRKQNHGSKKGGTPGKGDRA